MVGKYLFLTLIAVISFKEVFGKVLVTNVHVESNHDYVKATASLKKVNGRVLITGEGYVVRDIESDITMIGNIAILNNGHYEPVLRMEPISFCKFLSGKAKRPLLKLIWKMMGRFGKLPQSCPIKKGHYFVHDLEVDETLIPTIVPEADYRLEIEAFVNEMGVQKMIQKVVSHVSIMNDVDGDGDSSDDTQEDQ